MPNMRRLLGGLFVGLLFVASSCAQTGPRTVKIEETGFGNMHWLLPKINQEVIDAFSARVAASSRFVLKEASPELVATIICMDSRKENRGTGGFCTYKFEYHPKNIPEFSLPLGEPTLVAGAEVSQLAEHIFEEFVKETTEARLSVTELEVPLRVANYCSKPANQGPCSGKLQ